MPVFWFDCPDCGNTFQSLVLNGTRPPTIWTCSKCGGRRAAPSADRQPIPHPWETSHGSGCLCCAPAPIDTRPGPEPVPMEPDRDEA